MKHLTNDVKFEGRKYYVSTNNTFDVGLETMVFKYDENDKIDFSGVYTEHYRTEDEAKKGHKRICKNLGDYINVDEAKNEAHKKDSVLETKKEISVADVNEAIARAFAIYGHDHFEGKDGLMFGMIVGSEIAKLTIEHLFGKEEE